MPKVPPLAPQPSPFGRRLEPPTQTMPRDMRDATRATLLIRSGKLICQSGEYVCMVRDVSSSGVRLRLFHALPPEHYFFLEASNGQIFSMENRWCNDDEAGFRFIEPIDVDTFIEESSEMSRRPIRLRVSCEGHVAHHGQTTPMVLRNISQGGAQIEITIRLALHQTVKIAVGGLSECFAQIRWRDGKTHGLAFLHPLRLDELAAHALTLQPFAVQSTSAATDLPSITPD